jgi:hypothetical protein
MSLTLYRDPKLLDFVTVCYRAPEDEREQYAAFSGIAYEPERVAAELALRTGPKWVICDGDIPILVAGFDYLRKGVWQDWMISTPEAWSARNWRGVTRYAKKVMNVMLLDSAHRLQCESLSSRIHAHKWYKVLGLKLEGPLRGYGVGGEDALMFARLRDEA